ncbi:MAG: arginine--tRNA ligase [Candidatus Omnitrophica bacterium]|nr:arginine--tRNA ligase [Candidatus Omnitrophota bacterium]
MTDIIQELVGALQETVDIFRRQKIITKDYSVQKNDVTIPRERGYGEYCTPILSRIPSTLPREQLFQEFSQTLGTVLRNRGCVSIKKIDIVLPVFLNFHLNPEALQERLRSIIKNNEVGIEDIGQGKRVLLEFVSANPTGPLTIAHGRQAAFGEALGRILAYSGYRVTREYYLNDEGRQIDLLGESLKARCREILGEELLIPEDGYQGEYLVPLAQKLVSEFGPTVKEKESGFFSRAAMQEILEGIKCDLLDFGVAFDSYQSQRELTEQGLVLETLRILKELGVTYVSEGALFLKTTPFGDDKDRVLRKKDGSYTYLAPDLAYHRVKFQKGYDLIINFWGPDHYGYVNRLKAGVSFLGFDPEKIKIIIVQLTTIYRGGEKLKMSTRRGEFLPLSVLTEELSPDVTRFFFLSRKANSHLDFDLELAKKDSAENPIFYLQYATARIASIFRYQQEKMPDVSLDPAQVNLSLLQEPEELELMLLLSRFGPSVLVAAQNLEPQILLSYLLSLVKTFHQYYQRCQIVGPDENLTLARLSLVSGLESILKKGLFLLNVHAPERM